MTTEAKPAALTLPSLSDTLYVLDTWLAEGASKLERVRVNARESCDELGYEKHPHGGHTRESIAVVVKALRDLRPDPVPHRTHFGSEGVPPGSGYGWGEFARGAFKKWLEVRVEAVPPPEIAYTMKKLARTRQRRRKNL